MQEMHKESTMSVLCKDLFNLVTLKDLKIVAGEGGLFRKVTWAYIGENTKVSEWGKGGEILFITGIGLDRSEEGIMNMIKEANKCNLAGIVISLNDNYIAEIPKGAIELANRLDFPIFVLPWSVKRVEVSKEIARILIDEQKKEHIENELLYLLKKAELDDDIVRIQELLYTYNIDEGMLPTTIVFMFGGKESGEKYVSEIKSTVIEEFADRKKLILSDNKSVFVYLYMRKTPNQAEIKNAVEQIIKKVKFKLYAGICCSFTRESEATKIAMQTVKIAMCINNGNRVAVYEQLGIIRNIYTDLKIQKKKEYCNRVIKGLVEYDINNENYMIDTVIAYFENSYNISKTADALYIHRNTLMHRLGKIEEITGYDMKDPYVLTDLAYCALCYKMQS